MNKYIKLGVFSAAVLGMTSCGKDFLNVNNDPNNPTEVPRELVFPAGVMSTAGVVSGNYAILGGMWSQYWTQNPGSNQYRYIDQYNIFPANFGAQWQELYAGALNDLEYIKTDADAEGDNRAYLMATVMQVYTYQVLTDLYGDIPFDQALRANEDILNPEFQSGQEVYDGLITRLDEALARDLSAATPITSGDIVFNGNIDKWVQFANTLKLKIYLRQAYARPAVARAGIEALYADGANFLTEAASINIFESSPDKGNPLYEQNESPLNLNTNQNLKASLTLLNYLKSNSDTLRIQELFRPNSDGDFEGLAQGGFNVFTGDPTTISRARIEPTDPVFFISEAESYFLQAEAALRGWGSGDDEALYNAGVGAAYDLFGADATPWLTGPYAYPTGSFDDKLEAIIEQKWVSMADTYQGIEAFLEKNRTGYPDNFTYSEAGTTGGVFPVRLPFPDIERTRNPKTPSHVSITTPVWWDVN